jgi:uncharacterized protein YwbE
VALCGHRSNAKLTCDCACEKFYLLQLYGLSFIVRGGRSSLKAAGVVAQVWCSRPSTPLSREHRWTPHIQELARPVDRSRLVHHRFRYHSDIVAKRRTQSGRLTTGCRGDISTAQSRVQQGCRVQLEWAPGGPERQGCYNTQSVPECSSASRYRRCSRCSYHFIVH